MTHRTTIRIKLEVWSRIKDTYVQSYPVHQLSLNAWLVLMLQTGIGLGISNYSIKFDIPDYKDKEVTSTTE